MYCEDNYMNLDDDNDEMRMNVYYEEYAYDNLM